MMANRRGFPIVVSVMVIEIKSSWLNSLFLCSLGLLIWLSSRQRSYFAFHD